MSHMQDNPLKHKVSHKYKTVELTHQDEKDMG